MKREIITTQDGSQTIHIVDWDEHYHSKHGAIQEANYVYLNKGLGFFLNSENVKKEEAVSVLEIGFGTGLNAFLTLIEAEKHLINMQYVGVEAYPISAEELSQLCYPSVLNLEDETSVFNTLHTSKWNEFETISNHFQLKKQKQLFSEIKDINTYNVIYFDAFGPRVQPELWTEDIFKIMYNALKQNGVLVTYCAQGNARRAMQAVGFKVERLQGPPGKRHMLRAIKV